MSLRKIALLAALAAALLASLPESRALTLASRKLPVISATDADALQANIGRKVAVEGTVVSTIRPPTDKLRFINFSNSKTGGFTAALVPAVYAKFPDLESLDGQRARVTGKLKAYKQKTVIKVSRASQVKILKPPKAPKKTK